MFFVLQLRAQAIARCISHRCAAMASADKLKQDPRYVPLEKDNCEDRPYFKWEMGCPMMRGGEGEKCCGQGFKNSRAKYWSFDSKEAVMKKVCNHCVSSEAHKKDGKFLLWTDAKKHVESFLRKYPGAIAEYTETYEERCQYREEVITAEQIGDEEEADQVPQDAPDDDAAVEEDAQTAPVADAAKVAQWPGATAKSAASQKPAPKTHETAPGKTTTLSNREVEDLRQRTVFMNDMTTMMKTTLETAVRAMATVSQASSSSGSQGEAAPAKRPVRLSLMDEGPAAKAVKVMSLMDDDENCVKIPIDQLGQLASEIQNARTAAQEFNAKLGKVGRNICEILHNL